MDLQTIRQREGLYYLCGQCGGRAMTIPHVRRMTGDRFATRLLRLLKLDRTRNEHECPFCREPMVVLRISEPLIEVEGCNSCNAVWMDTPTYETLPKDVGESTNALSLLATEIFAERRLQELKEREEAERKKSRKRKRSEPREL